MMGIGLRDERFMAYEAIHKYVGDLEGELSKFLLNFVKDRPKKQLKWGKGRCQNFWEKCQRPL